MKGKKLNKKYAIPIGIAAALGLLLYIKRRKSTEGKATEPGSEGLTNQSFIPVTGENVPGAGASFGSSGGGGGSEGFLINYLKEQQTEAAAVRQEQKQEGRESLERERNFFEKILGNLGTGGGAPVSQGPPGITTAPPPAGPAPPSPVTPPAPPSSGGRKCPGDYPLWNPAAGAPSPHSCWRYSRERCPDRSHPFKHAYQDGHSVCASS